MKKTVQIMLAAFLMTGCAADPVPDQKPETETAPPSAVTETVLPEEAEETVPTVSVKAEYPEISPYPLMEEFTSHDKYYDAFDRWQENRMHLRMQSRAYSPLITGFAETVRPVLLAGHDTENSLYAPLNLYIALSMLAECTGGNTEKQILDLLGVSSTEELHSAVPALWNTNYSTGKGLTSILSDSVWIDHDYPVHQELLEQLAEYYYASGYYGKAGSEEMNTELQNWLDEATGGLLKEQADKIELSELTRLALASAILYRAKWTDEFDPEKTEEGVFHAPEGDLPCDMMRASRIGLYYWFDQFSAASLHLENSGSMYFFLPDEGVDVRQLLEDPAVGQVLTQQEIPDHTVFRIIDMSIPKLDILSDRDLKNDLKALGVSDVFDQELSDFTPLSDEKGITLDQAVHAARLTTDEEGVFAAAFTVLDMAGMGAPPDEIFVFTLDRPFFFILTSDDGSILFEGIVNHPKD